MANGKFLVLVQLLSPCAHPALLAWWCGCGVSWMAVALIQSGGNMREMSAENSEPENSSFPSQNGPPPWHRGVRDAPLNTHLQSFDGPIIVEEERPSLETPTRHTGHRPENGLKNGSFSPQNGPPHGTTA